MFIDNYSQLARFFVKQKYKRKFRIYSVSEPLPLVFLWPQLQIICCYIARYYVRKWHVRLAVMKNLGLSHHSPHEIIAPHYGINTKIAGAIDCLTTKLWGTIVGKTQKFMLTKLKGGGQNRIDPKFHIWPVLSIPGISYKKLNRYLAPFIVVVAVVKASGYFHWGVNPSVYQSISVYLFPVLTRSTFAHHSPGALVKLINFLWSIPRGSSENYQAQTLKPTHVTSKH